MKELTKAIEAYEKHIKMLAHAVVQCRLSIGEALRRERMKKKVSLRSLAKTLGISAAYLSDVELGKRNLSSTLYDKLKKL
jgi:predicted transcriptional regulator